MHKQYKIICEIKTLFSSIQLLITLQLAILSSDLSDILTVFSKLLTLQTKWKGTHPKIEVVKACAACNVYVLTAFNQLLTATNSPHK